MFTAALIPLQRGSTLGSSVDQGRRSTDMGVGASLVAVGGGICTTKSLPAPRFMLHPSVFALFLLRFLSLLLLIREPCSMSSLLVVLPTRVEASSSCFAFSKHSSIVCCCVSSFSYCSGNMFLLLSSTTLAAYVTVSPFLLSWYCFDHLLDHCTWHCIQIFSNDLHEHDPLRIKNQESRPSEGGTCTQVLIAVVS